MVFPPYAAPFPDAPPTATLGTQQRAMLTLLAQKPGRVVTSDQFAAKLGLPALTPRRADVLVGGINAALGEDAVVHIPRRGWMLQRYEDRPITISF